MKKYNKLIRDKIPEVIEDSGKSYKIRKLDDREYLEKVKEKIIEETNELVESKSRVDIINEIADVYEIIEALMDIKKITPSEVSKVKENKKVSRGAFDKKLLLIEVDD